MSSEERSVAAAVAASRRYRDVDPSLLARLAAEELPRSAGPDDAVKRVKRRLHQAVGAYRTAGSRDAEVERILDPIRAAYRGQLADAAFRAACRLALARHASSRERLPALERFFPTLWDATGGPPGSVIDLGCGFGPLALPWMGLDRQARYHAIDVDRVALAAVDAFLSLVGQRHAVEALDLAAATPMAPADLALLLKLIPILDRQDPRASGRLLRDVAVDRAVITFPSVSLGGRRKGMVSTYRRRMETLATEVGDRVLDLREVPVPGELVFLLQLAPPGGRPSG